MTLSYRCHLKTHATPWSGCLTRGEKHVVPPGEGLNGHRGTGMLESLALGPQAWRPLVETHSTGSEPKAGPS